MKHSIWVKIMVWVLVVLMAGSCAILALQFLVGAAEPRTLAVRQQPADQPESGAC